MNDLSSGIVDESKRLQSGYRWRQGYFSNITSEETVTSVPRYASLIRRCTVGRNVDQGRRLHQQLATSPCAKIRRDRYLANLLMDMYGKCGSVDEARAVFDGMAHPNVFSWNIVIAAYAHNGHLAVARSMFDMMEQKDAASWTCMIAAYGQAGHLSEARRLFDSMEQPSVVPWNAIISVYTHGGHHREALKLFQCMDLAGVLPNEITFVSVLDACGGCGGLAEGRIIHTHIKTLGVVDVVLATALVSMYGKCGAVAEAKRVFDGVPPARRNVVCWTSMLGSYAAIGEVAEAMRLFEAMPIKNIISWNAMMSAFVHNGDAAQAFLLFKRMDLEGVGVDEISFLSALDACASMSAAGSGRLLHAELKGLVEDVRVSTALLHFYARCGLLDEAKGVFDSCPTNSVSWNAMVSAYARNGYAGRAVDMVRAMGLEGFLPDEATLVALLSGCSHAGLVTRGLACFVGCSDDFGFVPSRDHFVCVVELLGRASWLDEAEELLCCMPFEPHAVAWLTLLSCCKLDSDTQRAIRAAANAWHLDPDNAAPYLLLNTI